MLKRLCRFFAICALGATLAACAATTGQETAGQYIDDATISTKVRAAILGDPQTKLSQISVETLQGTVQLSGFVDTPVASTRAEQLAGEVKGVKSVKNDIVVR